MAVGLDVGGANIKVSDGDKKSFSQPFPLWKDKDALGEAIRAALNGFDPGVPVALTMTGELADCFESKSEGVEFIVDTVKQIAGENRVQVYSSDGRFVGAVGSKTRLAQGRRGQLACAGQYRGAIGQHG